MWFIYLTEGIRISTKQDRIIYKRNMYRIYTAGFHMRFELENL